MLKLNHKIAIVTGAASGIGNAVVKTYLKEGVRVVAADVHAERLNALKDTMGDYAEQLLIKQVDLLNHDQLDELIHTAIHHFGGLDILVNNAGIMDHFQPVAELEDAIWEKVMNINLDVPFKLMRSALKYFLQKNAGNIINIASIAGLHAGRAGAAYTTSKFGLIGLTKNTGYMYAKAGIRCNVIAPGGVNTHIGETIDYNKITPLVNDRIMSGIALNPRMAEPEEIAAVALFLASDDASFVNGSVIVADGGWTAY